MSFQFQGKFHKRNFRILKVANIREEVFQDMSKVLNSPIVEQLNRTKD